MKNIFICIAFAFSFNALGQSPSKNYLKTKVYNKPSTGLQITSNDTVVNIDYHDGLGRKLQTIEVSAGGWGQDIVTPYVYDIRGRQTLEYLPYANPGKIKSSSSYRDNNSLISTIKNRYLQKFPEDLDAIAPNPYSETLFENSPLNRVLKEGAPGSNWQVKPLGTEDHTIKYSYGLNDGTEVFKFKISYAPGLIMPDLVPNGKYAANLLYKKTTYDENWTAAAGKNNTVEEFTDKEGRVILKRAYTDGIAHDTYYIYDKFSNLAYVLPPKATQGIETILVTTTPKVTKITGDILNLCYIYSYDNRNRIVEKQIPDGGWTFTVYDRLDRPVLVQNTEQKKAGKWLYTKYDRLDRAVVTGIYNTALTRESIQNSLDLMIDPVLHEKRLASPLYSLADTTPVYYTDSVFPQGGEVHTITYYDDYIPFPNVLPSSFALATSSAVQQVAKGLVTGTIVKVLDTSRFITTVIGYNEKGENIITKVKNNYLSTEDVDYKSYTFRGQVEYQRRNHVKAGQGAVDIYYKNTYDSRGRLKSQAESRTRLWGLLPLGATSMAVAYEYDELGRQVVKKVGDKDTSYLQDINYEHNIRGWLKGINDTSDMGNSLFAFKVGYEGLYNGNISSTLWNSGNLVQGYVYLYDALNRLKGGKSFDATDIVPPYESLVNTKYFEGLIDYDKNGNILKLSRNGFLGAPLLLAEYGSMDELVYNYGQNSNKLLKVTDNASKTYGYKDANAAGNDFAYDDNGNLTMDLDKGVGNGTIKYNHLNLPTEITKGTEKIQYFYDATGQKQEKQLSVNGTTQTTTQYANGFVYKNNALEYYTHSEGYARKESNGIFKYVYQYKDHLGNVRLSYADANGDGVINTPTTRIFYDGFESLGGWESINAMWGAALSSYDTSIKKFGKVSGKIEKPTALVLYVHNNTWVPINNTVDTEYIFSGWVYSDNPSVNLFMVGKTATETEYVSVAYNAPTSVKNRWVYLEKRVTVPANIKTLNMRLDNNGGGNVWFDEIMIRRVNPSAITEVIEETNYYPFGMAQTVYRAAATSTNLGQKIKYNGKELQDELGLNLYDYENRTYDPATARWLQVDPMAEQGRRWSPYNYAMDNPVYFIDPDGMWPENPFSGFINNARQAITRYVTKKGGELVKGAIAATVGKAKSYLNGKLNEMKNALTPSSSSKSGNNSKGGGFGFDFVVKSGDNAQNGMVKKDVGDRNTKQVDVDVLMELTNVHGPEGSRGQTPIVPTEASENSSSSSTSTMSNANREEETVTAERINYSATPIYGGGNAAMSTIHTPTSSKVNVTRTEAEKIKNANTADSLKAVEDRDRRNKTRRND